MNPIDRQNLENFRAQLEAQWQPLPWHARLGFALLRVWGFVCWWFVGDSEDEKTARRLWRTKLYLERCWELDEKREGRKS